MTDRSTLETLEWFTDTLRRYAPHPLCDDAAYEVAQFRRQCERDADFRDLQRDEEQERELDPRSDEQWFLEEQCPAESNFR